MSNAPQEVTITFKGDAAQLVAASKQVADSLKNVGTASQTMSAKTVAAGVAAGNILTSLTTRVMSLGREALSSFQTMGKEVYKMQLVVGGTAEEMSKLRYAAQMVGIDAAQVARGLGIASGAIAHNSDKWKQLGIAAKDSMGKTRSWVDLLPEISSKFRELGGSIDRTAAMKQVFGRGFAAVEPLLDLGPEALKQLGDEAERLGLVMSQDDVDAARELSVQTKMLKSNLQSVFVSIGRELVPVLGVFVQSMAQVADKIRSLWSDNSALSTVLKTVAIVTAVLTASLIAYKGALTVASVAANIFKLVMLEVDGAMAMNPVGLVIIGIVALIAALVWAAKTHAEWGETFVAVFQGVITFLGDFVAMVVEAFKIASDVAYTFLEAINATLDGLGWLAEKLSGVLGIKTGDLYDAQGIKDGRKKMDAELQSWADSALNWGGKFGQKWGQGLWDAMKNLKVPSLKDLLPEWELPSGELIDIPKGGGTNVIEERKKAILDFFKNLVSTSRDALNALRKAAIDSRKQMQEEANKIAETLRDSFNITDLVSTTFAKYLGIDSLMRGFRRKLDQMRQFVTDIRKLKALGLPTEMLAQIANAGVEGGAAAARLLVQHPEAMAELQSIQAEIASGATEAGRYVSEAVFGEQVQAKEQEAIAAQLQYRGYLDSARRVGYEATPEDLEAYTANIHNEVTINSTTMADPKQIADAVAWALKTGIALGMTPAGLPPAPTGYKPTGTKWYSSGVGRMRE